MSAGLRLVASSELFPVTKYRFRSGNWILEPSDTGKHWWLMSIANERPVRSYSNLVAGLSELERVSGTPASGFTMEAME
jgi:hypothetical protein